MKICGIGLGVGASVGAVVGTLGGIAAGVATWAIPIWNAMSNSPNAEVASWGKWVITFAGPGEMFVATTASGGMLVGALVGAGLAATIVCVAKGMGYCVSHAHKPHFSTPSFSQAGRVHNAIDLEKGISTIARPNVMKVTIVPDQKPVNDVPLSVEGMQPAMVFVKPPTVKDITKQVKVSKSHHATFGSDKMKKLKKHSQKSYSTSPSDYSYSESTPTAAVRR